MTDRDPIYDRASVYEEGDRVVFRASSLGNCIGALVRSRLGVTGSPPPEAMQARYDEGTAAEADVLARGLGVDWIEVKDPNHLSPFGKVVEAEGGRAQVETEIAWGNKVVRCHPDAVVVQGSTLKQFVCEVKFLGPDMFAEVLADLEKFLANHPTYRWQFSIESLSTGLPLLLVVGCKDIIEVDGERVLRGVGEVLTIEVDPALLYSLTDVKMRVAEVEGYVQRGDMPSCPLPLMYPCAYWADHPVADKPVITDEAMVAWIDVWKRSKDDLVKAEAAMDFVRGAIAEQMVELGITGGVCEGVALAQVPAQTQGNVSWKKAYDALVKESGKRVDEEKFRGEPKKGYVRIEAKDG